MEAQSLAVQDAKLKRDEDAIAILQDAVPQLDTLFIISHAIGHGTFSSVYFARTKHTTTINGRKHFAVKHIIPTSHPSRVFMEVKCLKMIGGSDNVMGMTMCFREMNHIVLVMPYFPHDSFSDYVGSLTTAELQDYLRNLLIALRRVHHFRIIHRDVKPANFLYSRKHRRYSLVDFGLAQEVSMLKKLGGNQVPSPPVMNTPHVASSKTAKRKLTVFAKDEFDEDKGKRSRCLSPPSSASSGVLSSTTNRVNTSLRRSPRKQCSLPVSPKKENIISPKNSKNIVSPVDSASNHPRTSEVGPKSGIHKDYSHKTPNQYLKLEQEAIRGLRRSPRKSMSAKLNGPLEGLAKYLQEATAANGKTLACKTENFLNDGTPSGNSSLLNRTPSLRHKQPHSAACSPRVSGIRDSQSQNKSTSAKAVMVLQEVHTKTGYVLKPVSCDCYGRARVCGVCLGRSAQHAPRAGTPGFRAPEVLLRHPDQGTAVDMWSVGVILMCLLSGRYPFFRAVDDLSTLAEISTLLGTFSIRRAAAKFGKLFTCSEERKPLDLMKICEVLRNSSLKNNNEKLDEDKVKGDSVVCSECRQSGICVCLDTMNIESCMQNSGQVNKKQTLVYESKIHRDMQKKHSSSPFNEHTLSVKKRKCISDNSCDMASEGLDGSGAATGIQNSNLNTENSSSVPAGNEPDVSKTHSSKEIVYPSSVYRLLIRFLDPDPETRITAEEALNHPFLNVSPI